VQHLRHSKAGTSAVEFAILSPLFLLFVFGMIAYGVYFGASHSVQQIAADAARTAVAGLNESDRVALARRFVAQNGGAYPFVEGGKLTLDLRDNPADTSEFVVAIRYDASNLPIWNLLPGLALPAVTIVRQSTIRIGGI
jgi:Flp pilus assembly protein TadG